MYWLFFFCRGGHSPCEPPVSHIKPLWASTKEDNVPYQTSVGQHKRRSSRRHPKFQGRSASRGGTSWGGGLRGHGRLFAWLSATNAAPCRLFFALCVSATAVAYSGLL